ncbi:5-cytosine rRNA methyltransferase NSUN4 [Gouania willdenowi]|uniref:5-cytosine rRNA methyltransferase NSUN4 n=1 Tax=Gouania willdenowi TaxID=441366 RepID=A0A8C5EKW5_GOUWI|nr:5-methylcytosine rRNA methyltransferase NSUN4 [Gouania willdenowi]
MAVESCRLLLRKLTATTLTPRRYRVKAKWAASHPKHPPTQLALQHFDKTLSAQLGRLWPSVRVALLTEKKYGALLNNFSDPSVLKDLREQGCIDFISREDEETTSEEEHADVSQSKADDQPSLPFQLSTNISCLVFPRGDVTRFRPARPDTCGLLGYYLMDAASLLPCLALNVQEGHMVLDLCAAPGGKSLALLQTQCVRFLCLNDSSVSRTLRLKKVLHSYVPTELLSKEKLRVTSFDGTNWGEIENNTFDRVLVDVPCTTDRHSLEEDDNNIFSKSRVGERRGLPKLQVELLLAGIEAAVPGGEIVYSTCSLSQSQNQCVVEQAVHIAQEHGIQLQVVDLRPLRKRFENIFHFDPDLPLGEMVIPHLAANFGPIYMCKLKRLV